MLQLQCIDVVVYSLLVLKYSVLRVTCHVIIRLENT